jgi:hypothetical protein
VAVATMPSPSAAASVGMLPSFIIVSAGSMQQIL